MAYRQRNGVSAYQRNGGVMVINQATGSRHDVGAAVDCYAILPTCARIVPFYYTVILIIEEEGKSSNEEEEKA